MVLHHNADAGGQVKRDGQKGRRGDGETDFPFSIFYFLFFIFYFLNLHFPFVIEENH